MYGPYTDLDLAVGWLFGNEERPPLADADTGAGPREVLERIVLELLQKGPLGVTFSGGQDTGALLAVALHVARREGLPEPVPLSLRFGSEETARDEAAQAAAIAVFGLHERWQRIDVAGASELLGPHARDGLRRHGLQFPPQAWWVRPMAERLAQVTGPGATLIAGHGQAELFAYWRFGALRDVATRKRPPRRADLELLRAAATPRRLREARARRRYAGRPLRWLRPGVSERMAQLTEPPAWRRYDRTITFLRARRCESETQRGYRRHAADYGVDAGFPRLDDRWLAAQVRHGGAFGFGDLPSHLEHLFGDVLPPILKARRDKAAYGRVFFGPETRAFAERWSGGGLPEDVVDPDVLRRLWTSDRYDWRTAALLQAAWLHDHRAGRC